MKNINTKTKIIASILTIVIIIGLIITLTIGLNFELKYQKTQKIQLFIGTEFEISDIKQITDEIFPEQEVIIQKAREYEDVVNITTKEITEEQKNNIITKINEKYELEDQNSDIHIVTIPHTRGRDIIKPYITPFIIATLIIVVYMAIKYRKQGVIKVILKSVLSIVIMQIALLSIMAITRIPIGRITIPLVLIVYILTLLGLTNYFEKN